MSTGSDGFVTEAFHVLFTEDEKIRHVGDAWHVEEVAMRWSSPTEESAFVAAAAAGPSS